MKKRLSMYSSILAILLCMTVIVGATFALFTSKDEVNIAVTAGQVKVTATILEETPATYSMGVEQTAGEFANGGTAVFDSATKEMKLTNVTPGDMANFTIQMKNESNVDVQYRVKWTVTGELAEALTATAGENEIVDNTSDWEMWEIPTSDEEKVKTISVSVLLPIETNDDYQNKTADINFVVEAVQGNAVVTEIESIEQLQSLFEIGGTAKLTDDVTLAEELTIPEGVTVNLDLNKKTVEGAIFVKGDVTISNGIWVNHDNSKSAIEINEGALTLDDVNIESARHGVRVDGSGVKVVINSGEYKVVAPVSSKMTQHALNVSGGATVTINGGTFIGPKDTPADSGAAVNVKSGSTVVINDGNFSGGKNNTLSGDGTLIVKGGIFDQAPAAAYLASGKTAAKTSDGTYMIVDQGKDVVYVEGLGDVVVPENVSKDEVVVIESEDKNAELQGKIADVLAEGHDAIYIATPGEYTLPDVPTGTTLTIAGTQDVKVGVMHDHGGESGGNCDYSFDGSTVTFDGITITTDNATYTGYVRMSGTYNNCTINGTYTLYGDSVFNNCTFNVSGNVYNIWTWGAKKAEFNNCIFNCDGKSILVYNGTTFCDLVVNGCTFNDLGDDTVTGKAAIEVGDDRMLGKVSLTVTNTTVKGFAVNPVGIVTGTTLFADKNSMGNRLTVTVDGLTFVSDGFWKDADGNCYVYNANGLAALSAKTFTENDNVAEETTVYILSDIDMNNADFSAIVAQRGDTLNVIGNGHTISNVNVISGEDTSDNATGQAGMFYTYSGSTLNVSNLTLKNIKVTANANDSGYAAAVIGYCEGTANLENVDVIGAEVIGVKSSGLIVGHLSGSLTAESCDVSGSVSLASYSGEPDGHYAGKAVGTIGSGANVTLNDCVFDVTVGGSLKGTNDLYGRNLGTLSVN